jgi:hypothetical protein|tara:strand:+ start:43 stop:2685 length:2643 start_codon:yes stop_codon:yes gene_type:complete
MKNFRDIVEARGDTAVFTFGRFNPPTTGHEKLIDALAKQQSKNAGSMMYVYPSHSQNAKKDPLPHTLKIAYMRKMFPKYKSNVIVSKSRTALEAAVELHKKGHRSIVMVVGSDRVTEFNTLLNKYNGVDSKHGFYGFDDIKVVSAGERDPDSEGVSGMSASKMRAAAADGDFDLFKTGVPSTFKDSLKLYNDVRKNLGIREERDMGEMTDFETLRDLYLTGKLWNVGDIVEAHGHEGKVINKGTNYLTFVSEDGKVHKTWLHDIVERDYKKEYENYQGTPEQIARRSSRNKARRLMGDKAVKGKDVGHKDNNPLNNDPSNLKMEDPSKNRREPRLRNEVKQDKEIKDREGTQPAKYYAKDTEGDTMAKSTKQARARHFDKKKSGPAPGDASATTKPSKHTKKFKQMFGEKPIDEVRAKQAVNSRGKVQKLVTAHGLKFKGKVYKEIDMELVKINNSTEMVTFNIIHPKEIFGNETNISFKALKRGPFMATDTSKINEVLGKDADMGDYIKDFEKSDSPQFKGKSKEKRKEMAIAAYLSKNEELEFYQLDEKIAGLVTKAKKSGMPYGILKKVYDRGMAAYKTGHRPGTTSQQWAFARVNSFVTKSAGTWGKADADLAKQVRGEDFGMIPKKKQKGHEVLGTGGAFGEKDKSKTNEENPCWDGFKQVGMKTKGGKQVPNCVPEETTAESCCDDCIDEKTLGKMAFDKIYKMTHPKHYDALVKAYANLVRNEPQKTHAHLAGRAVKQYNTKVDAKALMTYVNKLVAMGKLPKELKADFDVNQSESLNSWGEITETDKNSGKELNNPTKGDVKKYKVYVKNDKGNVVKVEFGDPNMEIKRDDPERRKAFRARHNCDQKKDKTTAGYWSCKFWSAKSVTDLMKG